MTPTAHALHLAGCAPAREGHVHNNCEWLMGFAAGRHVEREAVVAWLRGLADLAFPLKKSAVIRIVANGIEQCDHNEDEP